MEIDNKLLIDAINGIGIIDDRTIEYLNTNHLIQNIGGDVFIWKECYLESLDIKTLEYIYTSLREYNVPNELIKH